MKLSDLREMAIRGGNLTAMADAWAKRLETQIAASPNEHPVIGSLDDFVVRQKLFTMTVWDDQKMVLAAKVDPIPNVYCLVDDVWIAPEARGQRLFTKFLLFLKVDRGYSRLALGEVHSDDTYNLLKGGGLKAFKKHWEKSNGERAEFSPQTIDEFYRLGRWRLVLENTANLSRLIGESGFTHTYHAISHAVNLHEHDDFE